VEDVMRRLYLAAAVAAACLSAPVFAQNYNQTVVFGDSTVDGGWFKKASTGSGAFDSYIGAAVAAGGNAQWTGPGAGVAQLLADRFGLSVAPANTSGGTNYAIGGAVDYLVPGSTAAQAQTAGNVSSLYFPGAFQTPGTVTQIGNYLASVNNQANPNALYLISSGANDTTAAALAFGSPPSVLGYSYLHGEAQILANSVANLQAAGARYIIISDEYSPPSAIPAHAAYGKYLVSSFWGDLAAAHVNFVPADLNSAIAYAQSHGSEFGLTNTTGNACVNITPLSSGYGIGCVNSTQPSATHGYLVSANAQETYLFLDATHLTDAGNKIAADYYYSLLAAPSEISFLAENAVRTRLTLISNIQDQIGLSESHRGPAGVNAWVSGSLTSISMDNYPGLPGDPNNAYSAGVGADLPLAPGLIAGFAVSTGTLTSALGQYGSFKQQETGASLYAAYKAGPLWGNVIGTLGHLDYKVNRVVPIGSSLQGNNGSTGGDNWSAAFQGGYKFWNAGLTHGPIAGFIYQNVSVDSFAETGSFTSLAFGSQSRESGIGQLGYKASFDWSNIHPFAQVTWNYELADTGRNITASLTTVTAPSYSLPAVALGKDWGEVKGGASFDLGGGLKVIATGSADFGQVGATVYGAQAGLNMAF
jgi:outer membrane lipase/esterase